ncbi:hypothetical protein HRbin09_00688 [bacterium HR09]|nr:hypothetical protein HRbin09_00688 [bacterium HR09]
MQEIGGINFGLHRSHLDIPPHLKGPITRLKGKKLRFYQGDSNLRESELKGEELAIFRDILTHEHHALQNEIVRLNRWIESLRAQGVLPGMETGREKQEPLGLEEQRRAERDEKQAELRRIEAALEALRSVRDLPFVWDIAFVEIFEGDKGGFDIVVGNPPYVGKEVIAPPNLDPNDYGGATSELWKEVKKAYKFKLQESVAAAWPRFFRYRPGAGRFRKLDGQSDLYIYFYLHSLSLLNDRGSFCFITSNSWLDVGYGKDLQEFLLRHSHVKFILDNERKRSFAQADVNTIIALLAPPDDRRDWGLEKTARFVMFKVPFEQEVNAGTFKELEMATKRQTRSYWRITVLSQRELLEEGVATDEDDLRSTAASSGRLYITTATYKPNKWGGKYLRAPEIFFTVVDRNRYRLKNLGVLCQVEGYIHDNNIGAQFPEVHFIKSVKDTETIMICRNSTGVIRYGVKPTGNSRTVAPILFPRTFGERHIVIWNPEGILGKEFYKILPKDSALSVPIAAQLNSTFAILQREIIGLANLGEGGLKFSAHDVALFLVSPELTTLHVEAAFLRMASRPALPIAEELRQPDRRALDDVVFDVLGLTTGEREAVYEAVMELVRTRLEKARSV